MNWFAYATSKQFRAGTELMFELLKKHAVNKVLANVKDMVLIAMEDQHWLEYNFLPRATEAGFKAIALVQPKHYFNKVAIETISFKASSDKLQIQIFDEEAEAVKWLNKLTF